jgi:hypothetical protein
MLGGPSNLDSDRCRIPGTVACRPDHRTGGEKLETGTYKNAAQHSNNRDVRRLPKLNLIHASKFTD